MDYERTHKKSIEIAKQLLVEGKISQECAERMFPELVESEDEKIRKEIINYFKHHPNIIVKRERKSDWIAWLNRQGEQIPINPLVNEKMDAERWKDACKAACCDNNYRSHFGLTEARDDYFVDGVQWADEHPLQKPIEWNEEDEKMVNCIISATKEYQHLFNLGKISICIDVDKVGFWLKSLKDRVQSQ